MEYNEIKEMNLNNFKEIENIVLRELQEHKEALKEIMECDRIINDLKVYNKKDMLDLFINSLKYKLNRM